MSIHIPNESGSTNVMAEVDHHTLNHSHRDENSAPDQHDDKRPKPISEELPMTTPDVSKRTNRAQYPSDGQLPEIGHRDKTAAGWPAIYETVKYAARHGPIRDIISLSVVNQKGGVDCPSCAWPDPDGDRSFAEFCENGAKAIAWEATDKRIGPEFFSRHSIAELAKHPEKWLGDQGRITHPMVLRRGSQHYEPISWA